MRLLIKLIIFFSLSGLANAAVPAIFYSDILSGPKTGGQNNEGVFVTIWGNNFGSSQGLSYVTIGGGQAYSYPVWTNTMISFQIGSNAVTGNIVVTTASGSGSSAGSSTPFSFTVRTGNIYFYSPTALTNGNGAYATPWNTLTSVYSTMTTGDTIYLRAGTLTNGQYGYGGYSAMFAIGDGKGGSSANPIALITYPGETFTMACTGAGGVNYVIRTGGNGGSSWITLSKITMTNNGGAYGPLGNEGTGYRMVGNNIQSFNTNYGIIDFGGDSVKVLGNEIHDSYDASPNNETHSIYIDGTNTNFEVGWNYLHTNHNQGWEISCYHNGQRQGSIHDNLIISDYGAGAVKGILADGAGDGGTDNFPSMYTNIVKVYNNILVNLGQYENGGAIQTVCGTNYIYNNTIYYSGLENQGVLQFADDSCGPGGGNQVLYVANNTIYANVPGLYISNQNGSPPNWSDFVTLSKNNYYGEGNGPTQDTTALNANPLFVSPSTGIGGNFQLQSTSPLIGYGINTNSIVPNDYAGNIRPTTPSDGAYEYSSCSVNGTSCATGTSCCSSYCVTGVCSACVITGNSCSLNTDCCSNICTSNVCSTGSCSGIGIACTVGSSCCSGICCSNLCSLSCGGTVGIEAQLSGQCSLTGQSGIL